MAHTKQAESEGGRQQALKAVQEAWKQIDDLRADVRCAAVPCVGALPARVCVVASSIEQRLIARQGHLAPG